MVRESEEWIAIPGYCGKYHVSSLGHVKSYIEFIRDGNSRIREKILKPCPDNNGYLKVTFKLNGKKITERIHRLVGRMFIDNDDPYEKRCINHEDGDKTNNREDNLKWCTYSENEIHSYTALNKNKGYKLHPELVEEVLAMKNYHSVEDIAKRFRVCKTTIRNIYKYPDKYTRYRIIK